MWRTVLGYGLALAAAAIALEQLKFRFAETAISTELYVGLLALGFTALGLWVGHRLTARKPRARFERNGAAIASLGLTPRECQILDLLASGQSNKELARTLGVSPHTIKTHLASVFAKLEVDRRVKAIEKARFLSLIE
ncbi:response regulator transcription factor [Sphingomonas sp.]|jgi:DNA-binding CsgD family transcriptional regulator|uniref:response regulator transcription factor n=1 Tax=Sphingomonas sp. TaxID=28214 RepID=UPI002E33CCE8|nr:LuxR C-terminal-related transcriptional regulator [Sphingomonas sp.]HEX4695969.1 LuxR C-terminal-related transcriptional regulator [Sphingomonas sp.]